MIRALIMILLFLCNTNMALSQTISELSLEELKDAELLFQKNNIPLDKTLKIIRYHKDDIGHTIVLCSQFYKGLPVISGELGFHFDKSGKASNHITGTQIMRNVELPIELTPKISEFEALRIYINYGNGNPPTSDEEINRIWRDYKNSENSISIVLGIYNKDRGVSYVKPNYVLVWKVDNTIIDAQSGKVYYQPPRVIWN